MTGMPHPKIVVTGRIPDAGLDLLRSIDGSACGGPEPSGSSCRSHSLRWKCETNSQWSPVG